MNTRRLPVFADVDTGVDDAMALVYLLASPEADLIGLGSTAGNVGAQQVCANNLALMELCGRPDIPVSLGSAVPLSIPLRTAEDTHGPTGLGYAQLPVARAAPTGHDAATAWIRSARDHPGELIGLATGPLTNLALALRAEPELPRLLRRLVIMGGAFDYRGNTTPASEWNIAVDPEAAAEVFGAWGDAVAAGHVGELPIVCGLNITERMALHPPYLDRLAEAAGPHPVIGVLREALRFYFEFHDSVGEGYLAHVHDPFAAAVALDPALVITRDACVGVELDGALTRGMTVADWAGHWGRPANARIAVDGPGLPEVFFDRYLARVAPFARGLGEAM
ncbi:nucleoside hydrolase [Mycolicibacterium fallax]|uniref:Nucleoside hydrolase n=1 Tax=Mycolicibacterium fallax TaxID=1793 RepID=A0A1X1RF64_MYCFA|nr:nucleoside hydrolase [Mycolicibacterium fallax]ORV04339.1 nucleoside hydrolase [Mycolicibacterium fallax]HOW94633.1 nucleoside hydrolase [Mycolicibacterium fallax]HSA41681.1 nucleoside hydrolase [Mycobacterium sp.]